MSFQSLGTLKNVDLVLYSGTSKLCSAGPTHARKSEPFLDGPRRFRVRLLRPADGHAEYAMNGHVAQSGESIG